MLWRRSSIGRRGYELVIHIKECAAGRSSYVPEEALRGVADPGAYAVAIWMGALADVANP